MDPLEFFATTVEELWYTPYPKRTAGRVQRRRGRTRRHGGRPSVGGPQQRSPARGRGRHRGDREGRRRRTGRPADRRRPLDQRRVEPGRALAHRQRGQPERRADRDLTIAPGVRDAACPQPARDGGLRDPVRPSLVLQQRARRSVRRRRERRGERHGRRDHPPGRAGSPRAHEPLRERADAPVRGRPGLRRPLRHPVLPGPGPARGSARRDR